MVARKGPLKDKLVREVVERDISALTDRLSQREQQERALLFKLKVDNYLTMAKGVALISLSVSAGCALIALSVWLIATVIV